MSQGFALALTLGVELPLLALLSRWLTGTTPSPRILTLGAAGSLLSHPFAWNGLPLLRPHLGWWPSALLIELGVALFEAGLLAALLPLSLRRALLLAGLMNAGSFGVGLLWAAL